MRIIFLVILGLLSLAVEAQDFVMTGAWGMHSFRGDYSHLGDFRGTISPRYSISLDCWTSRIFGIKVEGTYGESRGYTPYEEGFYGFGAKMLNRDGLMYRRTKMEWVDVSGWFMLNLTNVFCRRKEIPYKHQIIFGFGGGTASHINRTTEQDRRMELSAHAMLQYSIFYTSSRKISLDFKVFGDAYQTYFDMEHGQFSKKAQLVDFNVGCAIGVSWYFNRKKKDNRNGNLEYDNFTSSKSQSNKSLRGRYNDSNHNSDIERPIKYETVTLKISKDSFTNKPAMIQELLPEDANVVMIQVEGNMEYSESEEIKRLMLMQPILAQSKFQIYNVNTTSNNITILIHYFHNDDK